VSVLGSFTPREVVSELDRYIVGQRDAKRAVAIALRNRWRRQQVPEPFVKVEASKFTEVGYVGRDVESIVRDLAETGVALVLEEQKCTVQAHAEERAEDRLLDALLPPVPMSEPGEVPQGGETREKLRRLLRQGALDEREVDVELEDGATAPTVSLFTPQGVEEMGMQFKDLLGGLIPTRTRKRRMKVPVALAALVAEEAGRLVDMDVVREQAIERVEQTGIVFVDELDKVAVGAGARTGPDVSREGVQRDLLPIVEGSTVQTKHGAVRTDHILFIAAGAFHMAKPSDLIPELQGRFPIRVELSSLGQEDFVRILTEPRNSLVRQYTELLDTEGVEIEFKEDGIRAIAEVAALVNRQSDDIGARRLHTVMEKLLEELSFEAPDLGRTRHVIDEAFVREQLEELAQDEDLSRYIL
jgi:ATP-dependent HslUV protease ATP-binding subunit HslU